MTVKAKQYHLLCLPVPTLSILTAYHRQQQSSLSCFPSFGSESAADARLNSPRQAGTQQSSLSCFPSFGSESAADARLDSPRQAGTQVQSDIGLPGSPGRGPAIGAETAAESEPQRHLSLIMVLLISMFFVRFTTTPPRQHILHSCPPYPLPTPAFTRSLCILQGICLCTWRLVRDGISGVYIALEFLDAILNFGQGFILFACFGLDTDLILLPCRKAYAFALNPSSSLFPL
ncbi:unnamed protein product [Protopolystoma xenopodis]|uniref:G-protein coupled receptors family 2 profile 2 domain-containing protein n=1 Tax=Protopolystoma xenopodis TaxID=117903 RepID=A0A3S5B8N7_9PLAT|nr:unnamed protein product [Protopolystoma xenopodis]